MSRWAGDRTGAATRGVATFVAAALVALAACNGGAPAGPTFTTRAVAAPEARDASVADGTTLDATTAADAGATLVANAGPSRYALVGENVTLDASGSTGAATYAWNLGDGRALPSATSPTATVSFTAPGRYTVVLTARAAGGETAHASFVLTVTHTATFPRSESAPLAVLPDKGTVAVVSHDTSELVVVADRAHGFGVVRRVPVAAGPRTVVRYKGFLAVVCEDDERVELEPEDGSPDGGVRPSVALPFGSRPYGAAVVGDRLFVTLAGTGSVARLRYDGTSLLVERIVAVAPDARAIASLPGDRLAVTSWRSPDDGGVITILGDLASVTPTKTTVRLAVDPQLASDTEIGGVPSYLSQLAVSPTGREVAVASVQANLADGVFRNGRDLTFETTLRAIASFVELGDPTAASPSVPAESFGRRKQFDNRGLAIAATYTRRGDFLYVAMPGNRTVERFDVLTETSSGNVPEVGFAPDGVALSDDDGTLYVSAPLSRELVAYDTAAFDTPAAPLARVKLVVTEPLAPSVLRGKQLFNDSADPRLSKDGYIACAHCHLEGDTDRRVWDFTGRGEGLRNTTSLLGRAGTGDGPVHWSANFDEIQDFEHDIRSAFDGKGLMADADFLQGTRNLKLGEPKAGVSADLDALAAYVSSLTSVPRSPTRPAAGQLSAAAQRGQAVFATAGCGTCHTGPRFTDSGWLAPPTSGGAPRLHDVGTLTAGSGKRLGATLTGIDTPTLRGVFATPPYLHDGSAPTLRAVIERNTAGKHGTTSTLTSGDLDDLVEYLKSL